MHIVAARGHQSAIIIIIIITSDLQPSTAIANQLPDQFFLQKLEPHRG